MELPVKKNKALLTNPKLLVIFSKPKAGKTTLLSLLDNNLILDLEDGTDYIDSLSVKIKNLTDLREVRAAIIKIFHILYLFNLQLYRLILITLHLPRAK